MSRSNPTNNNPHPCTRWFEFNGGAGEIEYYNKEKKESVGVPLPFSFLVLDETAAVRGWHDPSNSAITSNEVRDTRSDEIVVKCFSGGELCRGLYSQIRDRVGNLGGHFSTNLYIGYRDEGVLKLGCLQLKGAALNQWVEFKKAYSSAVREGAVSITGTKDGKKGSVSFKTPVFSPKEITPETNQEAIALDRVLQAYLAAYFDRAKNKQVAPAAQEPQAPEPEPATPPESDDVPF